jgi:PAS domain S-box-containing protein
MSNSKIMLVEDESVVAIDIKLRLESLGYIVNDIAPSGEEAIEKISKNPPDLVLMDIVLKGKLDGIETAQKIGALYNIPILYLTAYSDEKTLERAKITGPFGYIIKPFEDRELQSAIEIALYKHEMESKLRESEEWLSTTLTSIGDAVIATNQEGHVIFMNTKAETLSGWLETSAKGKRLEEVFRLIDEETGELQVPFGKVGENGMMEFNDHKLLITRNNDRIPVEYSVAQIKDNKEINTGLVLVFKDISQRKKAEKEKEELLKEKARGELSSFVVSALPVFASNIPIQVRNTITKSFADRFENNIKEKFEKDISNCMKNYNENFDNENNLFKCYLKWLSEFLSNLGIKTKINHEANKIHLKLLNCPWMDDSKPSPMFCLICRAIVIRSFTWTSLKGNVEQIFCLADGAESCSFEFLFKLNN